MSILRTRLLYGTLASLVGLYGLDAGVRKWYDEPTQQLQTRIDRLHGDIEKADDQLLALRHAPDTLEQFQQRSLPRDLELARSEYQKWLVQLVESAQLSQARVDSTAPVTRRVKGRVLYHALSFSIRGQAEMTQVTKVLFDFYATGHLHKIRTLSLTPVGNSERLDVAITIEAVTLPGTDRVGELSAVVNEDRVKLQLSDYQQLVRRDLFSRGGGLPGKHWFLTAVTTDAQGVREAWLLDQQRGHTEELQAGDRLPLGPTTAELTRVNSDSIRFRMDGTEWELSIGASLATAHPVEQ
ncbi:MAG: hypothetical protein KDA60_00365 [Planctomycetales bacterium]|nr:hypothetical protein [Planctomycetales bacterium]